MTVLQKGVAVAPVLVWLAWLGVAPAFVPPPCTDDPSRIIFAGGGQGPCKTFHGDQASCELAYYMNEDGEAVSCGYVEGTCVGCGGENYVCGTNTCDGAPKPLLPFTCAGDAARTALLGIGDNGSERCRNLDATDQATCENAFYQVHDDDDIGASVACFWNAPLGSCVGCGDNNSPCPFNACDPTIDAPDAVCTLAPERTNLIGYGGNGSRRCRTLDETDQATCENSYYEHEAYGLAVACWWDGNDCRGSGFDDHFARNVCLSPVAAPVAQATCPGDLDRANLLGFGNNHIRPCRQFDDSDQATCESSFYEDVVTGVGIACWWDGDDCRGSGDRYAAQNACQIEVEPAVAVCADGRTNLLGFGGNDTNQCRQLDGTDEATCEDGYYENVDSGAAVACEWIGNQCRGCAGHGSCSENPCLPDVCPGDPDRMNLLGFGSGGDRPCRQLDGSSEAACEDAFYRNDDTQQAVACWWDNIDSECRGSSRAFRHQNVCHTDAVCTREPGRVRVGFGNDGSQPCRQFDGSDPGTCEAAFYEERESGLPVACWWAPGDLCLGSNERSRLQNACLREPVAAAATCTGEPTRSLLGWGDNRSGDEGGACRRFDNTDVTMCEGAFYLSARTFAPVACWWDGDSDECRGSSAEHTKNNACDPREVSCALDADRDGFLGLGSRNQNACRELDDGNGGDQATCESSYYLSVSSVPAPVACWWNGAGECRGSTRHFVHNECFYENPLRTADATCGTRANLLGFGSDNSKERACRALDDTNEGICEDAYYEHGRLGYGVACWWDDVENECRGSAGSNFEQNVCPFDGVCTLDPGRNHLGVGFDELCDALVDQMDCEDAFYSDRESRRPIACWWDASEDLCRGSSNGEDVLRNACLRVPLPAATCGDRTTHIGRGENGSNACRQFDFMSQLVCEDAFYEDDEFQPVACAWLPGADLCLGTAAWDSLNSCRAGSAPTCDGDLGRTFIGRGDRDGVAACRQFDATDQETCENAFYENRDGEAVACWWDAGDCRGSNGDGLNPQYRLNNACVPAVSCPGRQTLIGLGTNGSESCRLFDNSDELTCEDAYYRDASGTPVACVWIADDDECRACGRRRIGGPFCENNACAPVVCTGAPDREFVQRCSDLETIGACEDSWHMTRSNDVPSFFAAACVWDAGRNRCFGCGPYSQGESACINICESGCGNGVIDDGETCDDGNMFDGDCCDSTCRLEADGSPCTDRLFCTVGAGACQAGSCIGAEPRPCQSCLANDCDETFNECGEGGRSEGAIGAAVLQGVNPPDMSFPLPPGTECDDGLPGTTSSCNGNGFCFGTVSSSTPTATATATATSTGMPTATPVPVGGSCTNTLECVSGAACIDNICTAVAAPAPVASARGLALVVMALIGIAALRLRFARRTSPRTR
jgi:hypothetical protein